MNSRKLPFTYHYWNTVTLIETFNVTNTLNPETALHKCSYEKVFWKYAVNLQENAHVEMSFLNKVVKKIY